MTKQSKIISYFKLPEMRIFWIILVPLLALTIVNFYFVHSFWGIVTLIISISVSLIVFFVSLKSAKTRFDLVTERNQIKLIIANFTDAIVAYDEDFKITAFNRVAEELFGVKQEDILGKVASPEWAKTPATAILTRVLFPSLAPSMTWRSEPNVYPQVVDITFLEPHLELTITTVRTIDANGMITGFFKIIKDKTREQELITAKSEFLTVAAHQLRTPLSGIKWTLESVINGDFGTITEQQKEVLNNGLIAAEKVSKTANDLLDTSNIESGKFGYEFVESDIIDLINKMMEGYAVLTQKHNIKIYFEYPPDGVPKFKFDPVRVRLIFQNLLENAIRYNVENGEIVIKLEKKDPFLEISVRDTGIGIPQSEVSKLFTKFFRAANVVKYETEGTGLGLYIVKNIIEAHGGKIWVESIENRGTTFYFTLPMAEGLITRRKFVSA
jgi:two-component system, NtrC family, sensor histidine kinase KinB